MQRSRAAGLPFLSVAFVVAFCAAQASAADENVTTKKVLIKDNVDILKRQIFAQSADLAVQYTDADSPGTGGASIHVWSATDEHCLVLPASAELWQDTGKAWKYKNPETRNQLTIQEKKLSLKIKSGVAFSLADDFPQEAVHVAVQFGAAGSRFCMSCSAPTKDTDYQFQAKECTAGSCATEPPGCLPAATTTTTSTTTTLPPPATVVGALAKSNGNFNYNLTVGLPGAEAACGTSFPGSHVCSYQELLGAQAGGSMVGLQDTTTATVTSFWAIDSGRPESSQCGDLAATRWHYATAHIGSGGDSVNLDNGTGTLSGYTEGGPSNRNCLSQKWVACCQ